MRRHRLCVLIPSALFSFAAAPAASAEVAHVVAPGETLWSIAAANNLTTRTVAVYNGVSEDHQVDPRLDDPRAHRRGGLRRAAERRDRARRAAAPRRSRDRARRRRRPAPQGAYTVRWGDTLSASPPARACRSPTWPR